MDNGSSPDIIRGVNVFPSQIEEHILSVPALAPHFLIELTRPDRMDMVRLSVEAREDTDQSTHAEHAYTLAHRIKTMVGISVKIDVAPAGSLPRSQGKAARVVDKRLR